MILIYQGLVGSLPKQNGQLFLYLIDVFAVFAENDSINHMSAASIAAVFQPGLIMHPDLRIDEDEYKLGQEVITFFIEHQDQFLPSV